MFIRAGDLAQIRAGSAENLIEAAREAAFEVFGDGARILATTFDTVAAVDPKDEKDQVRVLHFEYDAETGKLTPGETEVIEVSLVPEDQLYLLVAEEAGSIIESSFRGEGIDCNRLHWLSEHMVPGEVYHFSRAKKLIEDAQGGWRQLYEGAREDVRKAAHGMLQKLEGEVPAPRFSKLGDRLPAFEGELRESVVVLTEIASRVARDSSGLVFGEPSRCGINLADAARGIEEEAAEIAKTLPKAAGLARRLAPLAELHDHLAERVRDMAVMAEFLTRSAATTAPSETP